MKIRILITSAFLFLFMVSSSQVCDTIKIKSDTSSNKEIKFIKCLFNLDKSLEKQQFYNKFNLDSIKGRTKHKEIKKEKLGNLVFEDENYKVFENCYGEFGGMILFKDKHDGNCYYFQSVCFRQIEFVNGKYIILSSLDHFFGSTSISIIDNPKDLKLFDDKNFEDKTIFEIQEKYSSNIGDKIIDTVGITINMIIPYQNELYIIYSSSQDDCSYLGKFINSKLKMIDTLFTRSLYYGGIVSNNNRTYFEKFEHSSSMRSIFLDFFVSNRDELSGYLIVKNNTIIIGYKGKEKINRNTAN